MTSPEFNPKIATCVGYTWQGEPHCAACAPTNDTSVAIWDDDEDPGQCYVCGEPLALVLEDEPHKCGRNCSCEKARAQAEDHYDGLREERMIRGEG